MVDVVLQNAVPYRKRSPSDIFLDNGLALLYSHLTHAGIETEVIDWANQNFFSSLSDNEASNVIAEMISKGKKPGPEYLNFQLKLDYILKKNMEEKNSKIAEKIENDGVLVFGEKTFYGDAWQNSINLFAKIRNRSPKTIIVAGGPQVSVWREKIFCGSNADFFVIGEGENTLEKIILIAKEERDTKKTKKRIKQEAKEGKIKNLLFQENESFFHSSYSPVDVNSKKEPNYDFLSKGGLLPLNNLGG